MRLWSGHYHRLEIELAQGAIAEDRNGRSGGDEIFGGCDQRRIESRTICIGDIDCVIWPHECSSIMVDHSRDLTLCGKGKEPSLAWRNCPKIRLLVAEPIKQECRPSSSGD